MCRQNAGDAQSGQNNGRSIELRISHGGTHVDNLLRRSRFIDREIAVIELAVAHHLFEGFGAAHLGFMVLLHVIDMHGRPTCGDGCGDAKYQTGIGQDFRAMLLQKETALGCGFDQCTFNRHVCSLFVVVGELGLQSPLVG